MENNKLIAEFMGLKPKMESPDVYVFNDMPYFSVRENNPEDVMNAIVKYSKYDSDWNWLMSVVEKIEQLKNRHNFTFSVKISGNYCTIESYNYSLIVRIVECNDTTKLKSVYNACVRFIKWYNKQNKNNEKHLYITNR